jgi:hypothetical protein
VAEEFHSGVICQIRGIEWGKAEREEGRCLGDHVQCPLVRATGSEDSFYEPYYKTFVLDRPAWKCAVNALCLLGIHLRRDTMIPQWFQGSKAAAASDGHAVHF